VGLELQLLRLVAIAATINAKRYFLVVFMMLCIALELLGCAINFSVICIISV
jgi:hypothetical protein